MFLSLPCSRFQMINVIFLFVTTEFSYNIWWWDCFQDLRFCAKYTAGKHIGGISFHLVKCLSSVIWLCQGVQMCSCKLLLHNFYFRLCLRSFHAFLLMKIKLPADVTLWKYFLPFGVIAGSSAWGFNYCYNCL